MPEAILLGADVALNSWQDNLTVFENRQRGKTDACSMDMVLTPKNMGMFGMFLVSLYFTHLSGTVTTRWRVTLL